jgi:hypothetical protein
MEFLVVERVSSLEVYRQLFTVVKENILVTIGLQIYWIRNPFLMMSELVDSALLSMTQSCHVEACIP